MATLIHKINLLLLELDSVADLRNILSLVYSEKLLNILIDFCMNTENFSNFGLRTIEIFCFQYLDEILKTEIFQVIMGLLRTNDYETVAQCLSFVNVVVQSLRAREKEYEMNIKGSVRDGVLPQPKKISSILTPKLLQLILHNVTKNPQEA